DPIVTAFESLMLQDELTPEWLSLRHRVTYAMHRLIGRSNRVSDIRIAIYGPAALTALAPRFGSVRGGLPRKSFYAVHSQPKLFFEPADVSKYLDDPDIIGLHVSGKGRAKTAPLPGSVFAWAVERFGAR